MCRVRRESKLGGLLRLLCLCAHGVVFFCAISVHKSMF